MELLLILMILVPLAGAVTNGLFLRTPHARRAGVVATAAAGASFAIAVTLWMHLLSTGQPIFASLPWFDAGTVQMKWGFSFDWLTAVMALVVTGIGTVIHLYSIGYMSEDATPSRYFAYLNLFLCAMLTLVCGSNLVVMFVGWEGVGLCSYLLIGYWYEDLEKANAGIKAFVVNRIGDAAFLLGIFLLFGLFGSVDFATMSQGIVHVGAGNAATLSLAALCLFIGATGKSAQIPLYTWLPDAMAGPTPVSALIHAATMVTSGIYLVCRMNFLFHLTPDTNTIIVIIGTATALLAALIATSQNDIKKVLAYSTVSQLGLMFMALGAGAYVAAIFHVVTHAFFKALLFLGAGSVIHALEGEQDISKMGGLRKELPKTFLTFAIGTAAIAGIPPLAGFFSKDTILFSVMHGAGPVFWALGSFASLLTAFYMARLFALVLLGTYRGHAHAHESPAVMTLPLGILAVGSVFAGLLGVPHVFHFMPLILDHWLSPIVPMATHEGASAAAELTAMGVATVLAFAGVSLGLWFYSDPKRTEAPGKLLTPLRLVFNHKFWVDELYNAVFVTPFRFLSAFLARIIDPKVIDAMVILPVKVCRAGGSALSFLQIGSSQFYLLIMLLGGLAVFWFSLKGVL